MLRLRLAERVETEELVKFFGLHLDPSVDAAFFREYRCPSGVAAAVGRQEMLVATSSGRLAGALRFYRRKRNGGGISLYQFAVAPQARGRRLTNALLGLLDDDVTTSCLAESGLSGFFKRCGWAPAGADGPLLYWSLRREVARRDLLATGWRPGPPDCVERTPAGSYRPESQGPADGNLAEDDHR